MNKIVFNDVEFLTHEDIDGVQDALDEFIVVYKLLGFKMQFIHNDLIGVTVIHVYANSILEGTIYFHWRNNGGRCILAKILCNGFSIPIEEEKILEFEDLKLFKDILKKMTLNGECR